MANLKGILFDFDDTLIDWNGVDLNWREMQTSNLSKVFSYINDKVQPWDIEIEVLIDDYMERTNNAWAEGRSTLRAPNMPQLLFDSIMSLGIPEDKLDRDAIIKAYDWGKVEGSVVFPDVPPMLESLIANNIKIGIVTNASQPMEIRDAEVIAHNLIDYFPDCRLSAADAGYLKPHPKIFECALNMMGTLPEETVFIGDDLVADISGAQAAGMLAILRVKKDTQKMKSDLIVPDAAMNTMQELPHILDKWYSTWRNNGN